MEKELPRNSKQFTFPQQIGYRKHARSLAPVWMGMIMLFVLGLGACSSVKTPTSPTIEPQITNVTATAPQPSETPSPSPTPQPRVVLLAPDGADPQQKEALRILLKELAARSGMDFQVLASATPVDFTSDLQAVVVLPPDPGLATLAAAAPHTQFLAVGIPEVQPGTNISVIDTRGVRSDQQGFLAGYLASLVTQDWRVGVLSTNDDPAGKAQRQGFLNGAIFYCGLCRPAYPPFVQYPIYADLASGAPTADQQAAADSLIAQGVMTVYVAPGAGDSSLLEYLAGKGVNLIGSEPPPAAISDHWIATIHGDWLEGVRLAWDDMINNQPSSRQDLPLSISDRNETLFSIGRQRLAEQISAELASGLIDTGVDPATGETK